MKSMTGYGRSECSIGNTKVSIEIKSINSKQLDLNLKIPAFFREKETEIRSLAARYLERGKIDIFMTIDTGNTLSQVSINKDLFKQYYQEIKSIADEMQLPVTEDLLPLILKMPEVSSVSAFSPEENQWGILVSAMEDALKLLDKSRETEGNALYEDFEKRISLIQEKSAQLETFEKERIEIIRQKITGTLQQWQENQTIDPNRFEQELIYYLERIDFTEEKIRLRKHCRYFLDTMKENLSNGRKLGFITQEIGREINTLGSKANHAIIQKLVVEMKDELEKIKEQLLNIL
jgi:uncharacterized protein (TIGR00255 family)